MPAGITGPKPFDGSEHRSFLWEGNDCAALLVHGFPGTPAEMRPLGAVLREAGWTVRGLMLPGLGADIKTLDQRSAEDWANAVRQAARALRQDHSLIVLIGYSMGGALALHAARDQRPAALVLLAPFWTFGEGWLSFLWPVMRLMFRSVKPLKRVDFAAPEVRRALRRMFDNIDLDNPAVQDALRRTSVPLSVMEQVRRLGQSAFKQASGVEVPALVIQGCRDQVVPAYRTKRLIGRFIGTVEYHEVDAGHDLIDPENGDWSRIKKYLQMFVENIRQQGET